MIIDLTLDPIALQALNLSTLAPFAMQHLAQLSVKLRRVLHQVLERGSQLLAGTGKPAKEWQSSVEVEEVEAEESP